MFLKIKRASLIVFLFGLSIANANAYFMDFGGGVRPMGLSEAFVAVADDVNTMQYNAAGLSGLQELEIAGMYSSLYSNLNLRLYNQAHDSMGYNLLAVAAPLPEIQGGVGLTWKQFNTVFYQENAISLGYGRQVWVWGKSSAQGLAVDAGVNAKWLQWQLSANSFTSDTDIYPYSELQKSAFTADAGLMLRLFSHWKIGISGENLIPANLGLTTTEVVPPVYRLGGSYNLPIESR